MHPPLVTGPIPPYSNPQIEPQFFEPSQFFISSLTTGITTLVTTTVNHNYVIGQEVRLLIPKGYGSTQLNECTGLVIGIPMPNQVTLTTNSQQANQFINANLLQKPQIIAIGDVNTGAINAEGRDFTLTYIPGSFLNISPL
jgi:hypothetical protein